MTGQRPLRIGFLGAGMIATCDTGILPNLGPVADQVVVAAISSRHLAKAEAVASAFGIPRAYNSLAEMLDREDLDAVVNLTPIPVHGETSLAILEAGKHLVSEKPLGSTLAEADALIDLARSRDRLIVCSPPNMLEPTRRETRRLVRAGSIGQVAFARVRSSHGGPAAMAWPSDPTWFYQAGSGPLLDMGVYGIQEITGILGPAKRVMAMSGITEPVRTARGGPFDGLEIDVTTDDNVLVMLDFGDSVFALVDGTFNVNAARGPKIEVFGREGTINIWEPGPAEPHPRIELFQLDDSPGASGWVTPDLSQHAAAQRRLDQLQRGVLVAHLVDCLAEQSLPVLSGEHARHTLEIMLKAQESARTGRTVELETSFPTAALDR